MNTKELTDKLKVSYINKGLASDNTPIHSNDGDKMTIVSLRQALNYIRKLSFENKSDSIKGEYGALYCTPMETQLDIDWMRENHYKSGGVMFIDIDHVEEYMDKIYDSFEYLCSEVPNVIAMVSSHSGKGYHIFVLTDQLEPDEYKRIYCETMAMIVYTLNEHCGIDFSPLVDENGKTIEKYVDLANATMKQKFYISASKYIKINPNIKMIDYESEQVREIARKLKELLPYCFKKENDKEWMKKMNTVSFKREYDFDVEIKDMDEEYTAPEYLQHRQRMMLYGSLQYIFKTKEETDKQWKRCAYMMQTGEHTLEFLLKEPKKNKWFTRNLEYIDSDKSLYCDTELLKYFGIYVTWISKNNKEVLEHQLDWLLN